ncbi:MAG: phosphoglycerate dehydrogenase [Clostridiales bacterium]|nr:phosphoglycerate dehydrogenase [Clostridiales bacterium]
MKSTILITTSSFSTYGFDENLHIVLNPYERRLSEAEIKELIQIHQPIGMIAGVEPITRDVLEAAINLKVISRCGIGLDSIDLTAAKELGISVLNTPDAPKEAVAELALGMILSVLRNIPKLDRNIRSGNWKGPKGLLLNGKTIGIIGCGRIGSRLAELLEPFNCVLMGYDPAIKKHDSISMISLDDLILSADIVTLHIPLTAETKNILSSTKIKRLKKDAVIINAARGCLVDEKALYEELINGHLYGAALDCFEEEPYSGPLKDLNNVILSPHMGSSTYETRKIMESQAVKNLRFELNHLNLF